MIYILIFLVVLAVGNPVPKVQEVAAYAALVTFILLLAGC